ncbi:MAG: hypothetical protein ACRDQA_00740 [Nocardioidaceae bacterium]
MILTFSLTATCTNCGYITDGYTFRPCRINKRTMHTTGHGLAAMRHFSCPECGGAMSWPTVLGLHPVSEAEVDAYRAKRWPDTEEVWK